VSKILVTGGTGFLGSALVPLLAGGGHRLRLIGRGGADAAEALGAEVVRAPLQDRAAVKKALKGIEVVYHLAGQVDFTGEHARAMYELHVDCTRVLLEEALAAGVSRVVLASTSGTIGISRSDRVATEEDDYPLEVVGHWPYYLSKIYQEKTALRFHRDHGLPVVSLNPSLLLGPGDARLSSLDVVWKFLQRRIPAMPRGGISFVDVRDAAIAFEAALAKGRRGERYLLAGSNMPFKEFFGRLSRLSGVEPPRLRLPSKLNVLGARMLGAFHDWQKTEAPIDVHEVEMGEHFFYVDSGKAEAELGFAPRDSQETLHESVKYLRETFEKTAPPTVAEAFDRPASSAKQSAKPVRRPAAAKARAKPKKKARAGARR
jgi:dihydroflavonol-4-reductase